MLREAQREYCRQGTEDIGDFKKLTWRGNVEAAMRQVATPCAEAIADHVAKVLADRLTGSAVPPAIQPDLSGSRWDASRIYTSGTRPVDEPVPRAAAMPASSNVAISSTRASAASRMGNTSAA